MIFLIANGLMEYPVKCEFIPLQWQEIKNEKLLNNPVLKLSNITNNFTAILRL